MPDPTAPSTSGSTNDMTGLDFGDLQAGGLEKMLQAGGMDPAKMLQQLVGAPLPGGPDAELRTEVLLEDVEVLAVGRRYERSQPQERGNSYDTVTLLVSQEQAKTLAYARDVHNSPMTLILRGLEEAGS